MANLLDEHQPEDALNASYALVEGRDEPGRRVRETLRPLEGHEHNPGGWTVYTTRLALLGLLDAAGFRPGLGGVIRLGGDADTNGAVAGALLGARFGVGGIPSEWLRGVRGREDLLRPL